MINVLKQITSYLSILYSNKNDCKLNDHQVFKKEPMEIMDVLIVVFQDYTNFRKREGKNGELLIS